jgi:tRNA-binding EMAP/Myf-like protein
MPLDGYKVGLVVTRTPVPNKDNLTKIEVDVGADEHLIIVTNAKVFDNQRVAVATVGSKVEMEGEEVEVQKANVGGVPSEGMLCDSPMLGWVGGGAGVAAKMPDSYALGATPPSEKPRGDQVHLIVLLVPPLLPFDVNPSRPGVQNLMSQCLR